MNINQAVQVTKAGLEALKKELEELKSVKRPQLVDRLAHARSEGDLKENSDYQNARSELEFMDGRIEELEHVIKNAVVMSSSGGDEVVVGTRVTVETNGSEHVFEIVGEWEADPMQKKISHTSPIGQALSGKRVGEEVEVEAPAGKIVYKIVKID